MTAPSSVTYGRGAHEPEPTPDQDNLTAEVAALLVVGAAAAATVAALLALLRRRRVQVTAEALTYAYTLATARTAHTPRTIGRSDVARAQADLEAHYRAAFIVNAARRIQDAANTAAEKWQADPANRARVKAARDQAERDALAAEARQAAAEAMRAAAARERAYEAAHERARRARLQAAADVADAADQHGTLLGWHAQHDDLTTPECAAADGTNFRADRPPAIGWPGTLHGGKCRCRAGAPFPYAPSTDEATGLAGLTRGTR